MGNSKKQKIIRSNSALAIAAGCAVAFMLFATIFSIYSYNKTINEAKSLTKKSVDVEYDYYVAFISEDDTSGYWQSVYNAAKEYGDENGTYVDMLSTGINEKYSKYELMEMAIEARCDGILVQGDNTEKLQKLVRKAYSLGINVVTMENDSPGSDRISYIGVNNFSIAQLYAEEITNSLDSDIEVVIFEGSQDYEGGASILITGIQEAVSTVIGDTYKVNYETMLIENNDAFSKEEFIQGYFQENKLPDIIICMDELTTTCVYQAMIDYNKVGKVKLLGYYQSDTILTGIERGVIKSTVSIDTKAMGTNAVAAFVEFSNTGFVSDYYGIDANLITHENVDEYLSKEVADE